MKFHKRLATMLGLSLSVFMTAQTVLAAPTYKDVPNTYWAYTAIADIADKGLIVGDTSGNYNPDALINKFDASKIFAKVAGYKYTDLTAEEQASYNAVYDQYKDFLTQFGTRFTKWNAVSDREIAFLLGKGVYTEEDLNQFVILDANGNEQLRALSKEECAVFVTRLLGKQSDALAMNASVTFTDDASMKADYKPYVYYLKSLGVIAGDTDNNFNPKSAITKAMLATVLDKALSLGIDPATVVSATGSQTGGSSVPDVSFNAVSGTIDHVFNTASLNALQIADATGAKNIYKIAANATFYVDGLTRTLADIGEGMGVTGTLTNSELTEIRATTTGASGTPAQPLPPSAPATPTPNTPPAALSTVEGTVTNFDPVANAIEIEVKILSPKGDVVPSLTTYTLANSCDITRGGVNTGVADIKKGDIVTAEVSGGFAYTVNLEQKDVRITNGTLKAKERNNLNQPMLTIADENGTEYRFKVTSDSILTRDNEGDVEWDGLRIGDRVDATCEYDEIEVLDATGVTSTTEGTLKEIYISGEQSYFVITDDYDNTLQTYYIIPGSIDVYSVRIGDSIRLRLDSDEISAMVILDRSSTGSSVTGYIKTLRNSSLTLSNVTVNGGEDDNGNNEVFLDDSTLVIDAKSGNKIATSGLDEGQKVYVVFANNGSNVAKTITILNF